VVQIVVGNVFAVRGHLVRNDNLVQIVDAVLPVGPYILDVAD